ncbi:hypothetical protein EW145_g6146 [Phellinidium pouzarii]|uniref:Alpha/beta hydrolase fold-3 domain-containing protein n=1 Tax=Phellinidium pouzarii TaxID=167371 RepID=A0A4S4KY54_9AGAM|nr:hypothetical protein EW145_g6146 [Phellinidium pouzarii]
MAQWAHYSTPDPEWLAHKPVLWSDPNATPESENEGSETKLLRLQRRVAETLKQHVKEASAPVGITVEEQRIRMSRHPGEIAVRVYTPKLDDAEETFPVIIQLHGGGFCLGTLDNDELKCRALCATHRTVVVNVDYRLAPAFPWPVGLNDSYDAVKWVVRDAPDLRVSIDKGLIVSGESAGANFTCVIAQRARDDPELKGKITGQVLQIPSTCSGRLQGYPEKYKDQLLSFEQNKDDPIITRSMMKMFVDAYKPAPAGNPEVSPLLAESFVGLPPAYVQVAGADALRDEGLLYTQLMQESGVQTKLDVYPGVPHGFATSLPQLAEPEAVTPNVNGEL